MALLNIESARRNDVIEAFNKIFIKRAITPLITNDFESSQLSADRYFIGNNFEIYSDYTIKNYGFKSLTVKHALNISEIKFIISWFKKYIKSHIRSLQIAKRKRLKKVTRGHIEWIQNLIEKIQKSQL